MNLKDKLYAYISEFNKNDTEYVKTNISNDEAYEFLLGEMPLIEIPDKDIERAYYFRYWTYRKHIKNTPDGHIITEFLPQVSWSGAYNSINCATPFHLLEGRWLKDKSRLEEYIDFFLNGIGDAHVYTMAFVFAIYSFAKLGGREEFLKSRYEKIKEWHEKRLSRTKKIGSLYVSIDNYDGMEFGISGTGLRPTVNSYIYADAMALSKIAELAGKTEDAKAYREFAEQLKEKLVKILWDGDFFVTIPEAVAENSSEENYQINEENHVRELIGYVPWMFGIQEKGKEAAFKYLFDDKCFYTPYGLTTADMSHSRYMEEHNHECLWNGPIWPFATSQVLRALASAKQNDKEFCISNEDYTKLLRDYAKSHKRKLADGSLVDWIDENTSPKDGSWLSRDILEGWGFPEGKGGFERGKDYNHSLFGDLVLSGLLGISAEDGKISVAPLIPEAWDSFKVENLWVGGKCYNVTYKKGEETEIIEA